MVWWDVVVLMKFENEMKDRGVGGMCSRICNDGMGRGI